MVTAGAAVFAVITYFSQEKRKKTLTAIEQVAFFREKIISSEKNAVDKILEFYPDYKFPRIQVDKWSIDAVRKSTEKTVIDSQLMILNEKEIMNARSLLLNTMEELALRIRYSNTIDHSALNCIHQPFVFAVEWNIVVILNQKEIISGEKTYLEIINIYDQWKNRVDRRTPSERASGLTKSSNKK